MTEIEKLHAAIIAALPVAAQRLRDWEGISDKLRTKGADYRHLEAESRLYAALFSELKNAVQLLQAINELQQARSYGTEIADLQNSLRQLLGNISKL